MTSPIMASWAFRGNQYSYGFCAPIILVPFIYPMRPSAILKGTSEEHKKQKKDGGRHSNAEKNLPKVKSTVSFWMHSEWSGL